MTSYQQKAIRRGKSALILSAALLAGSFAALIAARFLPQGRAVGQLLAVVGLTFFIQVSNRYLFTEYLYQWEDGTLSFYTLKGKKSHPQGGIPLSEGTLLLSRREWKEKKKDYPLSQRFTYCQNPFSKDLQILLVPTEKERYLAVFFEPDDTLKGLISAEK